MVAQLWPGSCSCPVSVLPGAPAAPRAPETVASTSSESAFFEGRRWVPVVMSPSRPPTEAVSSQPQRFPPSAAAAAAAEARAAGTRRCPGRSGFTAGPPVGTSSKPLGPGDTHGGHLQTPVTPCRLWWPISVRGGGCPSPHSAPSRVAGRPRRAVPALTLGHTWTRGVASAPRLPLLS